MRIFIVVLMGVQMLFGKMEQWETFEKEQIAQKTKTRLSQVVIVRPNSVKGRAINVYIDGEYVTSLLPGAYTVETVCPGRHYIKLAYTNVLTHYEEKRKRSGQAFVFDPKEMFFFRIEKQRKALVVKKLTKQEAKDIDKRYKNRQNHTISRLDKRACLK